MNSAKLGIIYAILLVTLGCNNAKPVKNNVTCHKIQSQFLSKATEIVVVLPDTVNKEKRYPVLYVLGVFAQDKNPPLQEILKADIANKYQIICVIPTFDTMPWYADHPTDKNIRQETYIIKTVIPFVDSTYPTGKNQNRRYLIGFSKSGWGAFSLLLRYPDIFTKAAAWDAPLAHAKPNQWAMAEVFGTEENFENYRILSLLEKNGNVLGKDQRRLFLSGYGVHGESTQKTHQKMLELGIPHYYDFTEKREHTWNSGWFAKLADQMLSHTD